MWIALFGLITVALRVGALVWGIGAARTRKLALMGLVPAGASMGVFAWSFYATQVDVALRIAASLASIAGGMAHGVVFSLVALPPRKVWLRFLLVPLGIWTGTFAALWFAVPVAYHGPALPWLLPVLGAGTLTTWVLLPFWSRNRGWVWSGRRRVPSVRFACPRCGTRVDWRQGVAACTDCGLFLHILWPADELQSEEGRPVVASPPRSVRFDCPACGEHAEWPCGDSECAGCGLKVSLHWNVHRGPPDAA